VEVEKVCFHAAHKYVCVFELAAIDRHLKTDLACDSFANSDERREVYKCYG
jgi:hypothetical protein